ncbi:hypothetical protein Hanom_Chr03g00226701 [Helianthus anomalus]
MNIEVDDSVVKQEEEERQSAEVAVKEGDASYQVEDARGSINDEKNGGDDPLVLSDLSTADVPVMPTEVVEFGSVVGNLALTTSLLTNLALQQRVDGIFLGGIFLSGEY